MAEASVKRRGHGEDAIYFEAAKNRYDRRNGTRTAARPGQAHRRPSGPGRLGA